MASPMQRMRGLFHRARHARGALAGEADTTEYFSTLDRDTASWMALGAKMLSQDAVDGLVMRASRGSIGWDALAAQVRAQPRWRPSAGWNGEQLAAAAALFCVINPEQAAYVTAAKVLEGVLVTTSPEEWPPDLRMLSYQAATIARHRGVLERLSPHCQKLSGVTWVTRGDFARPRGDELGADEAGNPTEATASWWRIVNEPFVKDGLEPWELDPQPGVGEMFPWIHAPEVEGCSVLESEQPLVTVVVPVYNPDRGFFNTVESLIRQSWRNLEVVIVDDASSRGREIIEQAASMDPRIRIVTMERNSGAYAARNAGFEASRGEFATVLDADDLSHPRRIELQTVALLKNSQKMASGIAGIRMYADGVLTMYGFHTRRRNYSAFLFRREPVMEALGRFDSVRKSGDVEFHSRLQAVFGTDTIVQVRKHLSITQLTPGSLSRNDSRYVWLAGDRLAYLNQYRGWHRDAEAKGGKAALRMGPGRSFVAPPAFLGEEAARRFETAYLRDWSEGVSGLDLEELRTVDLGVGEARGVVGLLSGVHPRHSAPGRELVAPITWKAVEQREAAWLPWAREVSIGVLVVPDPAYLLVLPDRRFSKLTVERVIVVRGFEAEELAPVVSDAWVAGRCRELFGVDAEWCEVARGGAR